MSFAVVEDVQLKLYFVSVRVETGVKNDKFRENGEKRS